jgi:hypothetical protein
MSMRRRFAIVVTGVLLLFLGFEVGRLLRLGRSDALLLPGPVRSASVEAPAASARAGTATTGSLQPLTDAIARALDEERELQQSDLGRKVLSTVHESELHRDARHKYLTKEIDRIYPSLLPSKRDAFVEINDRSEAAMRGARASFMLNRTSEDDYIASIQQIARAVNEEYKKLLSRDEYLALEGNPDYDIFDPRAHDVPNAALSGDEAAALKSQPGGALGPVSKETME